MLTPLPMQPFLGLQLTRLRTSEFAIRLLARAQARQAPFTVGYLNAAQVNLAFADPAHARALADLSCLYADGQSIVWTSRRFGEGLPERINAGDFLREFLESAAREGLRLAIVGGRPDPAGGNGPASEVARAAAVFQDWAPALTLAYLHHGYLDDAAAARVGAELDAADPDLVLVAMGAPRQERRALEWAAQGRPRVWWCVGALLEYYSGSRRRAPVWMRRAGLEWLFRLAQEPLRLGGRYLVGNPLFLWRVWRRRHIPIR